MKRFGKAQITIVLVCLIVASIFTITVMQAKAATGGTHVFLVHRAMGNSFTVVGDCYAIITAIDTTNADMMSASTGLADTDYADCVLAFTADGENTDWASDTFPSLATNRPYSITFYETSGTPAAGDTVVLGPVRYNPETGETFTDTNSMYGGGIVTIPVNATH